MPDVPAGAVPEGDLEAIAAKPQQDGAPRTGVEIVSMVERNGVKYFALRDLRNGNVVNNVTLKSARRLWHYAIIQWNGNLGVTRRYKQGKGERFDLVQKTADGYRFYYGVTEDGIHGEWKELLGTEE